MRRFWLRSLLLGLVLLQALPGAAAPTPTAAGLEAEAIEVDPDLDRSVARGDASFTYRGLTLHADSITADRSTGELEASGNLELVQGARRLRGESLRYNINTEEGVLTQARVAEQGVFITGEEVTFSPTRLLARQARFTTCDHADPHYSFGADTIELTAEEVGPGEQPQSGRLTFDRARITYRNRRLFALPRYSVSVGRIREEGGTPLPVTGFSRDDGPYASISYALGNPEDPTFADLNYRYTTFRGIRGHIQARRTIGRLEVGGGYVRREDPSDREFDADDLEASLANVLLNREAEYGARLPGLPLGRSLRLQGEWLAGDYTEWIPGEEEARASAKRVAAGVVLSVEPYPASRNVSLSHALGWRRATYSPGDDFTTRFYRHSADLKLSPRASLSLAYLTRTSSGETPFLFDARGPGRELLADLKWQVTSQWGLRLLDLHDIEARQPRDMMVEVTRTAHCLAYTVGWRKSRGRFYVRIGLAPASGETETQ